MIRRLMLAAAMCSALPAAAQGLPVAQTGTPAGMLPLTDPSLACDFACKPDHPGARHFSNRSRRAVADEIFGR